MCGGRSTSHHAHLSTSMCKPPPDLVNSIRDKCICPSGYLHLSLGYSRGVQLAKRGLAPQMQRGRGTLRPHCNAELGPCNSKTITTSDSVQCKIVAACIVDQKLFRPRMPLQPKIYNATQYSESENVIGFQRRCTTYVHQSKYLGLVLQLQV